MTKLEFVITITEGNTQYYRRFGHKIEYLRAGNFSGSALSFVDPGGGYTVGYDIKLANWKTVAVAIMGTRSLTMVMPADPEMEKYYRKHTQLADAIDHVTINVVDPVRQVPFNFSPEFSIDIFNVTVAPNIITVMEKTTVGLMYSGATKIWF